jgi:hypothetical protein
MTLGDMVSFGGLTEGSMSGDSRTLILSRYRELNTEQKLLVKQLKLGLPSQPPPRITAQAGKPARAVTQQV